jgi:hypothetical protein
MRTQVDDGMTFSGAQISVTVFLSEWLLLNETSVRPKTSDQYKQIVKQHIVPDLGMIKLKDLNPRQIQALYSKKMAGGASGRTSVKGGVRKQHKKEPRGVAPSYV